MRDIQRKSESSVPVLFGNSEIRIPIPFCPGCFYIVLFEFDVWKGVYATAWGLYQPLLQFCLYDHDEYSIALLDTVFQPVQ